MAKKQFFLLIILAFLVLPLSVSGATTGTADITGNVLHVPVAQFTANITGGISPLAVQFIDRSDLDTTNWSWDFGDGTQSMVQNPVHTYTSGIYTINLTASNGAGNATIVAKDYITVLPVQVPAVPVTYFWEWQWWQQQRKRDPAVRPGESSRTGPGARTAITRRSTVGAGTGQPDPDH